jgi:hypothetical protein
MNRVVAATSLATIENWMTAPGSELGPATLGGKLFQCALPQKVLTKIMELAEVRMSDVGQLLMAREWAVSRTFTES